MFQRSSRNVPSKVAVSQERPWWRIFKYQLIKGCMSVCKMFSLNLMKKCWLAPGRVLASSEENALDLTRFV